MEGIYISRIILVTENLNQLIFDFDFEKYRSFHIFAWQIIEKNKSKEAEREKMYSIQQIQSWKNIENILVEC